MTQFCPVGLSDRVGAGWTNDTGGLKPAGPYWAMSILWAQSFSKLFSLFCPIIKYFLINVKIFWIILYIIIFFFLLYSAWDLAIPWKRMVKGDWDWEVREDRPNRIKHANETNASNFLVSLWLAKTNLACSWQPRVSDSKIKCTWACSVTYKNI